MFIYPFTHFFSLCFVLFHYPPFPVVVLLSLCFYSPLFFAAHDKDNLKSPDHTIALPSPSPTYYFVTLTSFHSRNFRRHERGSKMNARLCVCASVFT